MGESSAAKNLLGRILRSGWSVLKIIEKEEFQTGAYFSVCYEVEKNGEKGFLKAFDFVPFKRMAEAGKTTMDIMGDMINAYNYEKELSQICKNGHVTQVAFVKDFGEEYIEGFSDPIVPYLIFELADGDVRKLLHYSNKLDMTWKFKSLHSIAKGINQLHKLEISHQDIKPSNILIFDGNTMIGDLGRALCKFLNIPHKNEVFAGDNRYAPPEILYRYYESEWRRRLFSTDCYLLGSLVVFYFSGISMTAMLKKYIPENMQWHNWRGEYNDVIGYVLDAFSQSLDEIENCVEGEYFKSELRNIIEQLCYPIPSKRGHSKLVGIKGNQYDLERFITKLDVLMNKARYEFVGNK